MSDAARQSAPGRLCDARLRYALLGGIALLSAWLAISINNSIDEVNAELEMIRANIARPLPTAAAGNVVVSTSPNAAR
jgi:hypothetical protein